MSGQTTCPKCGAQLPPNVIATAKALGSTAWCPDCVPLRYRQLDATVEPPPPPRCHDCGVDLTSENMSGNKPVGELLDVLNGPPRCERCALLAAVTDALEESMQRATSLDRVLEIARGYQHRGTDDH